MPTIWPAKCCTTEAARTLCRKLSRKTSSWILPGPATVIRRDWRNEHCESLGSKLMDEAASRTKFNFLPTDAEMSAMEQFRTERGVRTRKATALELLRLGLNAAKGKLADRVTRSGL